MTTDDGVDLEARALAKLIDVRAGESADEPVPRGILDVVLYGLLVAPISLWLGYIVSRAAARGDGSAVLWALAFFVGITAALAYQGYRMYRDSVPRTPELAVKQFYRALAKGRYQKAKRRVLMADFDDLPRVQPQIRNLGYASGRGYDFSQPQEFDEYWRALLRSHPLPYCLVRFSKMKVTPLTPDVAIVDFELRLVMNTQMWWLLILVALLLAAIMDAVTQKRVKVPMRRLAVRVGDQWRLIHGAWIGPEDQSGDWVPPLPDKPAEQAPYRSADRPHPLR